MNTAAENVRSRAADMPESRCIINAFRFMEELASQIEAMRAVCMAELKSSSLLRAMNLRVDNFGGKSEMESSKWLCRSALKTFDIFEIRPGRPRALLRGALQVSLAPESSDADADFFPHIAVLLAEADGTSPWDIGEFQLDDRALQERDEDGGLYWEPAGSDRWIARENFDGAAFVVPLFDLKNEQDVRNLVIGRMCEEIKSLLERMHADKPVSSPA